MPLPAKILEFPVDGRFWFVKWIDEFTLPHWGTDSASVKVILQKFPISKATELSRLKDDALLAILGQRSKGDPEPEVMKRHPVVLAGLLPALHIGAVFHNQEHIGDLPAASATRQQRQPTSSRPNCHFSAMAPSSRRCRRRTAKPTAPRHLQKNRGLWTKSPWASLEIKEMLSIKVSQRS